MTDKQEKKMIKAANKHWFDESGGYDKKDIMVDAFVKGYKQSFALHVASTRSFNELEMLAEDLECVKMWLDDKKAPKTDSDGNEYSVVGRIQYLLNVC